MYGHVHESGTAKIAYLPFLKKSEVLEFLTVHVSYVYIQLLQYTQERFRSAYWQIKQTYEGATRFSGVYNHFSIIDIFQLGKGFARIQSTVSF